jgi:hypothetical protein
VRAIVAPFRGAAQDVARVGSGVVRACGRGGIRSDHPHNGDAAVRRGKGWLFRGANVVSRLRRRAKQPSRWPGLAVSLILIGAAVATELRKPVQTRTWEGRIADLVPYDLRLPTLARARERLWNRADRRIVVPTVVGVGWTVNFARLLKPWAADTRDPAGDRA